MTVSGCVSTASSTVSVTTLTMVDSTTAAETSAGRASNSSAQRADEIDVGVLAWITATANAMPSSPTRRPTPQAIGGTATRRIAVASAAPDASSRAVSRASWSPRRSSMSATAPPAKSRLALATGPGREKPPRFTITPAATA